MAGNWYGSLEGLAHLLVEDRVIVRAFKKEFGANAVPILRALHQQDWDALGETAATVADLLVDTLGNDARLYSRYHGIGPDDDRYHIEVMGLGDVYFVRAAEFGDSDLFEDLGDAESWIENDWNTNLVSYRPRRYRAAFSTGGKDCARMFRDQESLALGVK